MTIYNQYTFSILSEQFQILTTKIYIKEINNYIYKVYNLYQQTPNNLYQCDLQNTFLSNVNLSGIK